MSRASAGTLSQEDFDAARRFLLFADLVDDEVRRLLRAATARIYPRGSVLFTQGDRADRFYLVLDGAVKLVKNTESGEEGIVEVFSAGTSFGEAAMFFSRRFPLGAQVLSDARLIQVPADSFLAELERTPEVAYKLLAALSRHQRRLVRQISELKLKSPVQRLGLYFLSLHAIPAAPLSVTGDTASGRITAQLPLDKGVVAGRVGITPESFSRALTRLRDVGVTCRGRDVVIEDVAALRAFCVLDEEP